MRIAGDNGRRSLYKIYYKRAHYYRAAWSILRARPGQVGSRPIVPMNTHVR